MARPEFELRKIGRDYFVVWQMVLWTEPTRKFVYYPVSTDRSMGYFPALVDQPLSDCRDGVFRLSHVSPDFHRPGMREARIALLHNEKTAPNEELCESEPIPPPKTRQPTRWNDGRWQKLLKKGWVDA